MDIKGKVSVVTGGASGIGQAVTRRIAAAGGKVVIFDLNEDAGQAAVAEAPAAAVMVKVKKEDVEPRIAIIANPQ